MMSFRQIKHHLLKNKYNMSSSNSTLNLVHIKYSSSEYIGQVLNGKKHGIGRLVYNSGRKYEGQWESDLRHGQGKEQYANGDSYVGNFAQGKADGKGIYTWKNGDIYHTFILLYILSKMFSLSFHKK